TTSPAFAPTPHAWSRVTRPNTSNSPTALWLTVPSSPSNAVTVAVQLPRKPWSGMSKAYSKVRVEVAVSTGVIATGPSRVTPFASAMTTLAEPTSAPPNGSLATARTYTVSPSTEYPGTAPPGQPA